MFGSEYAMDKLFYAEDLLFILWKLCSGTNFIQFFNDHLLTIYYVKITVNIISQ